MKISLCFYISALCLLVTLLGSIGEALPANRQENKTTDSHTNHAPLIKLKRSPMRKPFRLAYPGHSPRVAKRQLIINYGPPGPGSPTAPDADDLNFHVDDVQSLNTFESILPAFGIKSHNIALIRSMLSGNMLKYNLFLLKKTVALLKKINSFLTNYLPQQGQQNSLYHAALNGSKNYELLHALINAGYGQQLLNFNGQLGASTPSPTSTISTRLVNSHKHYDIPYNNRPVTTTEGPRLVYDYPIAEVKEIIEETERIIQKHHEQSTVGSFRPNQPQWTTPSSKLVVTEPPKHLDFVPNFSGYEGSSVENTGPALDIRGHFNYGPPQPTAPTDLAQKPDPDYDLPFVHKTTFYNFPQEDNYKLLNFNGGFDFQDLPHSDSVPDFQSGFNRATEYTLDYVTNEGEVNLDQPLPLETSKFATSGGDFAGHDFQSPENTHFNRKEVQFSNKQFGSGGFSSIFNQEDLSDIFNPKVLPKRPGASPYQHVGQIPLDKHNIFDNDNRRLLNSYGEPSRL